MSIICSLNDRIPVQIGEDTFFFRPLSQGEKMNFISDVQHAKDDQVKLMTLMNELLRSLLKKVEGIKRSDGSEWNLRFEDGKVTKECLEELAFLPCYETLMLVSGQFLRAVPSENGEILHPMTGKAIEGITVKKTIQAMQ
jgi:hypothetical protein